MDSQMVAVRQRTTGSSSLAATRNFREIRERAKFTILHHALLSGHKCATLLLLAGENPKIVCEETWSQSIVMTLDTYPHVLPSMQQAVTEKLEKILFSKAGTL